MTIEEHLELLRARLDAVEQWESDMRRLHWPTWRREDWWTSGQMAASLVAAMESVNRLDFWTRKMAEISKTGKGDKA
jgi:hypothetical protein